MPYNLSESVIENMKPFLVQLLEADEKHSGYAWEVPRGMAKSTSYKLREALKAAEVHKDKYPEYAKLGVKYKISVRNDSHVIARLKAPIALRSGLQSLGYTPEEANSEIERSYTSPPAIEHGGVGISLAEVFTPPQRVKSQQINGEYNEYGIIEKWGHAVNAAKLYFPDTTLDYEGMRRLYTWARKQQPPVRFVGDEGVAGITVFLLSIDPSMEEFAWRPAE